MPSRAPSRLSAERVSAVLVLLVLTAGAVILTFRQGAYVVSGWILLVALLGVFGAFLALSAPGVRLAARQKAILGVAWALAAWTAASIMWASSTNNAWIETNRTLLYVACFSLVVVAVRWQGPRSLTLLAGAVTAVVGAVALVIVVKLVVAANPLGYFSDGFLDWPVTYHNGMAAFLMTGFWLALGLSAKKRREWGGRWLWLQPLLLMLAVALLQLNLLTESRGAVWTLGVVVLIFLAVSPHRFRALANLVLVAVPTILFWPRFTAVYSASQAKTGTAGGVTGQAALHAALSAMAWSLLIVLVAWALTWAVERWTPALNRRVVLVIGLVLVVAGCACAVVGVRQVAHRSNLEVTAYVQQQWDQFTSDKSGAGTVTAGRFGEVGLNGRVAQWRVAVQAFIGHPLLGLGAQNFEVYWYQNRSVEMTIRQPHSQPLQFLAELGVPGALLGVALVGGSLVFALMTRFRRRRHAVGPDGRPRGVDPAVSTAMICAVLAWAIQGSVDWLWQLAAVTLPIMALLGGLAAGGGQAGLRTAPARGRVWLSGQGWVLRTGLAIVCLAVIASAALPYYSLKYSALAQSAGLTLDQKIASTKTAAKLDPTSTLPLQTRAAVYEAKADSVKSDEHASAAYLSLAADAWLEAAKVEPNSWTVHYFAANALTRYLEAQSSGLSAVQVSALQAQARTQLNEATRLNPLLKNVATEG